MRAWHFTNTNEPLVQVELPAPVLGPGEISEVGEGVTGWAVGDRVGICPTTSFGAPGFVTDGGFGEKVTCPATAPVRIPDGLQRLHDGRVVGRMVVIY